MTRSGFVGVKKAPAEKLPLDTQLDLVEQEMYKWRRRAKSSYLRVEKQKRFYLTQISRMNELILSNQPLKAAELGRSLLND